MACDACRPAAAIEAGSALSYAPVSASSPEEGGEPSAARGKYLFVFDLFRFDMVYGLA
jgi:hypothetical protein